ncbi:hypothetical protein QU870_05865, partial [Escherichia coli]|nr:hypothetical protein [Escherichia coli]
MCVLSTDSSLNTNFQNGTAYECNRASATMIGDDETNWGTKSLAILDMP